MSGSLSRRPSASRPDRVQATTEELDTDVEPQVVLGACPDLALQALQAETATGLLLPCNVVVRREGGSTLVSALDPQFADGAQRAASSSVSRDERLRAGAGSVTALLEGRIGRDLQSASGLSKADYDVLVPLSEAPGGRLRAYEIARTLSWEQSRLSHHLARMQKRELVEREECLTDRRGAFIVLTRAGRCAIELAVPAHVATVRELVVDDLTEDQVATLRDITRTVLARLEPEACDETGTTQPGNDRSGTTGTSGST